MKLVVWKNHLVGQILLKTASEKTRLLKNGVYNYLYLDSSRAEPFIFTIINEKTSKIKENFRQKMRFLSLVDFDPTHD